MRPTGDLRCVNLSRDRNTGQFWQDQFCRMAEGYGCICEDKQRSRDVAAVATFNGRRLILPDLQICKDMKTVLPEIKHKNPTAHGQYGWEQYRLDDCVEYARQSGLQVIMAVHDWSLAGGKEVSSNAIEHWRWADVLEMADSFDYRNPLGVTWKGGQKTTAPICYWKTSRFSLLTAHPFFSDADRGRAKRDPSRPSSRQTMLFKRTEL